MATRAKPVVHTEQRNPRTRGLDLKSTREILRLLNREDQRVPAAVAREIPNIARAVDRIVQAFRAGGRLIYVGAGTSGRLAALDAAECPPTFGIPRSMVRAIIAGGSRALTHAVEGAEDSIVRGARDLAVARVSAKDVVVGISASGSTPYVLSALCYAKKRGAETVGLTSNPKAPIARIAAVTIAPDTGPEAIAGSTRMKAGTAQKLVLNMLSTAALVRMGRVYDNWMVGVTVRNAKTNRKLRQRATRILQQAAGAAPSAAARALRQAGHDLPLALVMLKRAMTAAQASAALAFAGGDLRAALGERTPIRSTRHSARRNLDG
jgi:N-acetylmuramic acid 6-phosphate etherase